MALLSKTIYVPLLLLMMLCQLNTFGQLSFSAKISPGTIGKNETAELRLLVENAGKVEEINPPSLKDFIVVGGPNQETGMESINGVTRQYTGITYILQPRSKGRFRIAPATAKADGKTLRSNAVTLEVTNSSSAGTSNSSSSLFRRITPLYDPVQQSGYKDYILKTGENVSEKINKNIFIKVDVSKNTCYVGEPVVVTYKLYTRLKSESSIIKNPSFNGFSVIDLMPPGNTYYSLETLNGREYNVYTLRKSQLYPLQTGQIELESAEVENNIHFIKEEYLKTHRNEFEDMFRDFAQTTIAADGMHDEKVTLLSKPVFINVKPVPEKDKTDLFMGAVGNFNIESTIERTTFSTDDAGKLRVVISGEGNMTMITAPDVDWPAGIESFDPKVREQLNKYAVPVSGLKVFEYPFTVPKTGRFVLPPVKFCYFDTKQHTYKTVVTKQFEVVVKQGTGKSPLFTQGGRKNEKSDFFEILFTNRWLIIVPIGIFIITGLFVWLKNDKKHSKQQQHFMPASAPLLEPVPAPMVLDPLVLTKEKLIQEDQKGFYEALNKEFRIFLADKLQLPSETINRKKIAEEADKKGIPVSTCLQIQQLLDDIEWQLYTPFADPGKMLHVYNNANTVVHDLDATVQ